jgi:hypothetical protein
MEGREGMSAPENRAIALPKETGILQSMDGHGLILTN